MLRDEVIIIVLALVVAFGAMALADPNEDHSPTVAAHSH